MSPPADGFPLLAGVPLTPERLDLNARAGVVVDFDLPELISDGDDVDRVLDFLDADCELIRTPAGTERWTVKDARRRHTLASVPLTELRRLRELSRAADESLLQDALDRSLASGWTESDLQRLAPAAAQALSVVAGWWAGRTPLVPTEERMRRLVDRLSLFSDVRAMADDHFIGRQVLLSELRNQFLASRPPPFVVHGLGGIGKSAVIARHIVWAIDEAAAKVALLDFDDATLNPFYPGDIASRIIDLVSRQVEDDDKAALDRLTVVAGDIADSVPFRGESSSRKSHGDTLDWELLIGDLLALIPSQMLVVLDTFEQVQRRGPSAVSSLLTLIYSLVSHTDRIRVLISGRAEIPDLPLATSRHLTGLDPHEAARLLISMSEAPIERDTAKAIVDLLGTSPLTIRLASQLLATGDGRPSELFALDVKGEQVNAELYRRVLSHIRDLDVRKLAHPGLVLRRITADVILRVLSRPCGVPVTDEWHARSLFERFGNEAMLVERTPDGQGLIHRADIRQVMLPQMLLDMPEAAARIQRSAVRYYAGRDDLVSKIEELYHRLMLGQSAGTLAKHWDDRAADPLVAAMDEFPLTSRIFLATHLPETYLSEDDRRLIDDSLWIAQLEPQVLSLLSSRHPERALELLRERRGPDGSSLLPALEIEVLESVGQFEPAMAIARERRRTAAEQGAVPDVVTFSLHLARLLELTEQGENAEAVLDETLGSITEPSIERLRLLVASLGLDRRLRGDLASQLSKQRQQEAISLGKQLGLKAVRRVPGLMRDLAAEVGTRASDILIDALRTLGLDAYPSGSVAEAMRDLDNVVAQEQGTQEGGVADIARLGRTGTSVDWYQITSKPRGETGRALSEVLSTYGDEAAGLTHAVVNDYRYEADSAFLGQAVDQIAKR